MTFSGLLRTRGMQVLTGPLLTVVLLAGIPQAHAGQAPAPDPYANVEIEVIPVKGNVYMLVGAGGNVTVQAGPDGVMVVDTMFAPLGDKLLAAIKSISGSPIRYVVNTHMHADHTGGNLGIARAGRALAGANMGALNPLAGARAQIIAHENVVQRMSTDQQGQPAVDPDLWPTMSYFIGNKEVHLNDEPVILIHMPAAHTDGDSIVFFRRSDVVSTGDVFTTTRYPFIDAANGGSVQGIIAALNRILDLVISKSATEGGTLVIPGHGRLSDELDVLEYRDMVVIIAERIRRMVEKGMTLEQIVAAKPTLDYDPRFGAESGFWTTRQFIEAVHRDVQRAPVHQYPLAPGGER